MMDYKEALKELSYDATAYGGACTTEVREAAIKALEKQIPKKVISLGAGMGFQCPNCHHNRFWKDGCCCKDCGQKLDWSEENE